MARISVFYHYLHPDPNVSSVHLSELCSGLAERGWHVTAYPSNRNVEKTELAYPARELWRGVKIHRVWRPGVSRSSSLGRILGAGWMVARWSLLALKPGTKTDAIIVGTDPICSVFIAMAWRLLRPRTVIAHWCFDLYPEAAVADGLLSEGGLGVRLLKQMLRRSYQACDVIADIGPCMRALIDLYGGHDGRGWRRETLVPWALEEPGSALAVAGAEREAVFGWGAREGLALMYSGTFGRAHSSEDMLELMRELGADARLAFSVKGQREAALRESAEGMDNVGFVAFAAQQDLERRLAAADIHVVSLREEWTGMVIPSKFFGALAVGRPVLFCGSPRSSLAVWIREYGLGWVLEPGQAKQVAAEIRAVVAEPGGLERMNQRCCEVYSREFSRATTVERWSGALREAVLRRGL